MQTVIRSLAWVLVFVAPAAAAASWFTPRPALDAAEAAQTALGALDEVGVEGEVTEPVVLAPHVPEDGDPVDAWVVLVDVAGDETIEVRVQESAGRLVYVDDRIGPEDTERLLTDDQFDAIGEYRDDVTSGQWIQRNVVAVAAAAVAAAVAFVIAKRSDPLWKET